MLMMHQVKELFTLWNCSFKLYGTHR